MTKLVADIGDKEVNPAFYTHALISAAERGLTEIVAILVKSMGDVNPEVYINPLHAAVKGGHTTTVQVLLETGVDVDCVVRYGPPPLFIASKLGDTETVRILLAWGAAINKCDTHLFSSAVVAAAECGNTRTVAVLLQAGARVNLVKDKASSSLMGNRSSGLNALDFAILGGQSNTACLLYAAGSHICKYTIDNHKHRDVIPQFILDDQEPLFPLMDLCRRLLRSHLLSSAGGNHNNLINVVPQLPLPKRIKQFLLFNIDVSELIEEIEDIGLSA